MTDDKISVPELRCYITERKSGGWPVLDMETEVAAALLRAVEAAHEMRSVVKVFGGNEITVRTLIANLDEALAPFTFEESAAPAEVEPRGLRFAAAEVDSLRRQRELLQETVARLRGELAEALRLLDTAPLHTPTHSLDGDEGPWVDQREALLARHAKEAGDG